MAVLKYRTFWIALGIISFILLFVIRDAIKAHHRMMFSNLYATHTMGLFPEWQPQPPISDRLRNIVAKDERLNILLIAFNDEPEGKNFYWGRRDRNHAVLLVSGDRREPPSYDMIPVTTIHRTRNRLIVLDLMTNTRFEADLEENEADRIFKNARDMDYYTQDFSELKEMLRLEFNYPVDASPLQAETRSEDAAAQIKQH